MRPFTQQGHQVGDHPGRQYHLAGLRHAGTHPALDGNLPIGGRHLQAAIRAAQQHPGVRHHQGTRGHGRQHGLQDRRQSLLITVQLHFSPPRS